MFDVFLVATDGFTKGSAFGILSDNPAKTMTAMTIGIKNNPYLLSNFIFSPLSSIVSNLIKSYLKKVVFRNKS
ncbi:hypothetical protein SDC9_157284 [bioreactor metagenome]|uniref:Uncharacterized protein n=1 Tax=bioreactor metagenome TaxID=1076179 RepID=A0A645F6U2_9ZZZZ